MEKAIGIDLGTTYSVMAIVDKHLKVIQNREAEDLTRSVVGIRKGELVTGNTAYKFMAKGEPKDIIVSIKRIIGRGFSDSNVQRWKNKVKYKIKVPEGATDKSVAVLLGEKEYLPEEISAEILKKLKNDAEERGYKIDKAVITVPAYFNDKQKDATRRAGYLAGLQVLRILPEPTASAISYKVDELETGESRAVLVYDLGGGTFDIALLQITGGTFIELGIGGDMWLGGDDFDEKLMQFVLKQAAVKNGLENSIELLNNINVQDRFMAEFSLKEACRKAKEELSAVQKTDITIPSWARDVKGNVIDIEVDVDRSDFEGLIGKDIDRSIEIIKRVLQEAKYEIDQVGNILLVGGSSLIPLVRKKLSDAFSESKILLHTRPMLCVAEGAAILANRLVQADKVECPHCGKEMASEVENCPHCQKEVNLINPPVTMYNMSLGIETADESFCEIMPKGNYYPAGPFSKTFFTEENQHIIFVPVKQFNHIDSVEAVLGAFWLIILKDKKVGKDTPVEVIMNIDQDGIVSVTAKFLDGSGLSASKSIGGKDQECLEYIYKVEKMIREKETKLGNAEKHQVQEKLIKIMQEFAGGNIEEVKKIEGDIKQIIDKNQGGNKSQEKHVNLVNYSEYILKRYHVLLDPELTYSIQKLVEKLKEYTESEDADNAEKTFLELDKVTDNIPKNINFIDWVARAGWLVEPDDPVLANELDNYAQMLVDLCKHNKYQEFETKANEIMHQVEEIYKNKSEAGQQDKIVDANLLLRSKKSNY